MLTCPRGIATEGGLGPDTTGWPRPMTEIPSHMAGSIIYLEYIPQRNKKIYLEYSCIFGRFSCKPTSTHITLALAHLYKAG